MAGQGAPAGGIWARAAGIQPVLDSVFIRLMSGHFPETDRQTDMQRSSAAHTAEQDSPPREEPGKQSTNGKCWKDDTGQRSQLSQANHQVEAFSEEKESSRSIIGRKEQAGRPAGRPRPIHKAAPGRHLQSKRRVHAVEDRPTLEQRAVLPWVSC